MEQLIEFGIFILKLIFIIFAFMICVSVVISSRKDDKASGRVKTSVLNKKYKGYKMAMIEDAYSDKAKKQFIKQQKKLRKTKKVTKKPNVYVLNYKGDIQANSNDALREEITAIMQVATKGDEVLVRLESPGGVVHGYGLAASQLQRIKSLKGVNLVIAVDLVAASGGYMMASVAHKIIAAPFAIVGSIGVIAQIPNVNKVLKKAGVDFEMHTAGQYKRTLTVFGENTEDGRKKFKEDIEHIHTLFKKHIADNRPQINIDEVSTGETWFGQDALDNHLVDTVSTSDDYILQKIKNGNKVINVKYEVKQSLQSKLKQSVSEGIVQTVMRLTQLTEYKGKQF